MIYRASQDVYVQHEAKTFSISLNLIVRDPVEAARRQYLFDVDRGIVDAHADERAGSTSSLFEVASILCDPEIRSVLEDIVECGSDARLRERARVAFSAT